MPFFIKSQVNTFINKFFFGVPMHCDLFTARVHLHANSSVYEINESGNGISSSFYDHPYITNFPNHEHKPFLSFQFNDSGKSEIRQLTVSYDASQINACVSAYNELIRIFKPYTQRSMPADSYDSRTNEKSGEGVRIYPIKGANFYIANITYSYSKGANRYELQVLIFEDNLWK